MSCHIPGGNAAYLLAPDMDDVVEHVESTHHIYYITTTKARAYWFVAYIP